MKELVGNFTREDLLQLPNTISIVKQVAGGSSGNPLDGHFGLGMAVAHREICNLGDIGCLAVGIPGTGKTTAMDALRTINPKKLYQSDKTLAALGGKTQKMKDKKSGDIVEMVTGDQEFFSHASVLWLSPDFSRLSDMHQLNLLKVVCALITEHRIAQGTMSYDLAIEDCNLSWMGACAYETYGDLWDSNLWRGNFRDRIHRYHQLIHKRLIINETTPQPQITLNCPKLKDVKLSDSEGFKACVDMLEAQFTDERAPMWASRLGRASASLNHRTEVTEADWKFLQLYRLNYEVERMVGYRQRMAGRLQIDADALQILSEVVKRGESTTDFLIGKYLISDEETFMATIKQMKGSLLEETTDNKLIPSEILRHDYLAPQDAFEIFCLHRGPEFYTNGGPQK